MKLQSPPYPGAAGGGPRDPGPCLPGARVQPAALEDRQAATRIRFALLGPLEAYSDGRPVELGRRIQRVILAILLLEANHVVPVSRLVDLAWPETPPRSARASVQAYVSRLRALLKDVGGDEECCLDRVGDGYALRIDPSWVDAHRFVELVQRARGADDIEALALFDQALALWRGRPLAEIDADDMRARLSRGLCEMREAAVESRAERALSLGLHAEHLPELSAAVAEFPLRERLAELQVLALYRAGRRPEALTAFTRIRTRLAGDLGIEPGPGLHRLQQAILRDDPELDRAWQPRARKPATVATIGRAPARAALVPPSRNGAGEPGARRQAARPASMAQLPPDITDFTGRDEYLDRIRELLAREGDEQGPAVRIAAIAGRPGVGKSAVAIRAAHQLRPLFRGGQLYVDLRRDHGPADPAEVLGRFLRALGAGPVDLPGSLDERAAVYRSLVAGRRLLVVLDNASGAEQVLPLLPGTPTCAVLVTSRRPLTDLPGSRLVEVDLPSRAEAVALLRQVVGPIRADREVHAARRLTDLCGRLPLAVRAAGARLVAKPHWNLADLLRRLADERYRLDELVHGKLDVRASLALSYRELAEPERVLFCRLALLDLPDITLEAAAAVLGRSPVEADRVLERLVDARLLDPACGPAGQHLYRFHDLIRLYGRERAHTEPD